MVKDDERRTPSRLFLWADRQWGPFTVDAAATDENCLAPRHLRDALDGIPWGSDSLPLGIGGGDVVWLNPPYSAGMIFRFVEAAQQEIARQHVQRVVLLLPHDSSTGWWRLATNIGRRYGEQMCREIVTIAPRIPFLTRTGKREGGARLPSAFVVLEWPNGVKGPLWTGPRRGHLDAHGLIGTR